MPQWANARRPEADPTGRWPWPQSGGTMREMSVRIPLLPLLLAGLMGLLTAALFAFRPLARAQRLSAAGLFRGHLEQRGDEDHDHHTPTGVFQIRGHAWE